MEVISCGKLTTGIVAYDCENPFTMGMVPTVTLINYDDIDFDKTTVEDGVITALELKTGKTGYLAQTLNDGIDSNIALVKGAYNNGWDTNVVVRIFDNTPEAKKFINDLSLAKVVVITQSRYIKHEAAAGVKGNTVYQAFGFYTGLELNEATQDSTDADTKGGYVCTLGCDENNKEPVLPLSIFKTDLATTEQMIDALIVP